MTIFVPSDLRMNREFTIETMLVKTQVENKHESRNRKALSWIKRKRFREVASRRKSAITSAIIQMNGDGRYFNLFLLLTD
jgi:hypothetical protein